MALGRPAEQKLIELEREGWEALSGTGGGAYYRERLAANALMAFPFGVMERDEAIAAMEAAQPWASFEIRDARVVALGEAAGVVVYSVLAHREAQEPFRAVIASTYVREDGDWKLAFHQQSPSS